MKFTNVKQLIIKFMGGGLINFPTRFLRWVKINGDIEGDDDGGDDGGSEEGNSNIFLSPLVIQPSYYAIPESEEDNPTIHEIQDIANTISSTYSEDKEVMLFYSKEQLVNLGISENILNNLQQVTFPEFIEDAELSFSKCYKDDGGNLNDIIYNNYIIYYASLRNDSIMCDRIILTNDVLGIYKFGDDMYYFVTVQPLG